MDKYYIKAKKLYDDENTGHDFSHIERVLGFANEILKYEGGDEFVVYISCLFHDVHRILSNKKGIFVSAKESIPVVKDLLEEFDLDNSTLEKVLYVIEHHDDKVEDETMLLELKIVQDADILDALGKIGLERTLKYCKKNNIPLTDDRYSLDSSEYIPDINPISTTHYVYRTMIPQASVLHTKTAKELAKGEVKILEDFLKEHTKKLIM